MNDQIDQFHPIDSILNLSNPSVDDDQAIAIISPLIQLSFVYHIAIHCLKRQPRLDSKGLVTVVAPSKSTFQHLLAQENDARLIQGLQNQDAKLFDCIDFRFCADLPQLLTLLSGLNQSLTNTSLHLDGLPSSPALIFTDVSVYLTSSGQPTLANLTRLLGFISSVQLQLSVSTASPLGHIPSLYLIDRIDHDTQWSLSASSKPEEVGSVLKVFQHFFPKTWYINPPINENPTSSHLFHIYPTFRAPRITYQVVQEKHYDEFLEKIMGPLHRSVVVQETP
ncbi:hypothetical protein O181_115213 [Austropuccinia psidii MF-1]|uniref:Uncharacterized protein n=1 Tax=Austropuccinia psidii MF-1 TaxID=1389203 RepID=A0A9Q3K5Z8_9BASI|nr:hypothetical protein [Austropuccinia psidii MF-1]